MNPYIKNLNRIEFLMTFACTGRCKHCSEGDHKNTGETHEILSVFNAMGIPISSGNVIFPGGNALKYLSEYFDLSVRHKSKYVENPQDIKAICVIPNGNVLGGNIYKTDIIDILKNYNPEVV